MERNLDNSLLERKASVNANNFFETAFPIIKYASIGAVVTSFGVGVYKGYLESNGYHLESKMADAALTFTPPLICATSAYFGRARCVFKKTRDMKKSLIAASRVPMKGVVVSGIAYFFGKGVGLAVGKLAN